MNISSLALVTASSLMQSTHDSQSVSIIW